MEEGKEGRPSRPAWPRARYAYTRRLRQTSARAAWAVGDVNHRLEGLPRPLLLGRQGRLGGDWRGGAPSGGDWTAAKWGGRSVRR